MTTNVTFKRVLLVSLFALACAGLTSLGLWQLSRAEAKRLRFEDFTARRDAPAIDIDAIGDQAPTADYYWRPILLRGHYRETHILLDNRVRNTQAGYEVLTPFRTDGGRTVLVNRGWVALPGLREAVPDVIAPADPFVIRGYVGPPPVVGVDIGGVGAEPEWLAPRMVRVQRVDFAALSAVIEDAPWPAVVYLDKQAPGALDADWPVPGDGSARHTAYAVQWFTMAVVLAIIGLWNWRRRPQVDV
jgi:surfeit locus 1 family protein